MKLYLIEGTSAFFRAYHSRPPMQLPDGTPCNALYGYAEMLHRMLRRAEDATHVAVVMDAPNSRRHRREIYADYKANRPSPPDELRAQLPRAGEVAAVFGVPVIEVDGYEADDVIATYAKQAAESGGDVVIVTTDKDLMQMMGANVHIFDPMIKMRMLTREDAIAKFGVPPHAIPDAQALIGDATDNIPGCAGIGRKTAGQLLTSFGSLDAIYANIGAVASSRLRALLLEGKEAAMLSRRLVTLKLDVPIEQPVASLSWSGIDYDRLGNWLHGMGFSKLAAEMA